MWYQKEIDSSTFFTITWYNNREWKLEFRYVDKRCWLLVIGKLWFDMDGVPF